MIKLFSSDGKIVLNLIIEFFWKMLRVFWITQKIENVKLKIYCLQNESKHFKEFSKDFSFKYSGPSTYHCSIIKYKLWFFQCISFLFMDIEIDYVLVYHTFKNQISELKSVLTMAKGIWKSIFSWCYIFHGFMCIIRGHP